MNEFKTSGIIEFEPEHKTKKHERQSSWKRIVLIRLNCDMHLYYRWFLERRFNLKLNKPLRGAHITFISDKGIDEKLYNECKRKYNRKRIAFSYDVSPKTNGEHWWLKVKCQQAEAIREEMGLNRIPYFSFHLTLGYANEKNIEHSNYIWRLYKKGFLI